MLAQVFANIFGERTPCKKSADLHPRQGNLFQRNNFSFTSQNRVETSWKKFAHFFQHERSISRFLWLKVGSDFTMQLSVRLRQDGCMCYDFFREKISAPRGKSLCAYVIPGGQCYNDHFWRFSQMVGKNWRFSWKSMLWSIFAYTS
jgi:hypothetical protein